MDNFELVHFGNGGITKMTFEIVHSESKGVIKMTFRIINSENYFWIQKLTSS